MGRALQLACRTFGAEVAEKSLAELVMPVGNRDAWQSKLMFSHVRDRR
jgi:hypothetical protein